MSWSMIIENVTYSLDNLADVGVGEFDEVGMAPIEYFTESGAQQMGATVRGYRLRPRTIPLVIWAVEKTKTAYWGKRDEILRMFRPGRMILLKKTLPDGGVRQIVGYMSGGMTLGSRERKNWTQKIGLTLFCPDPLWYDPTPVTFTNTATVDDDHPENAVFDIPYTGSADTYPVITLESANTAEKPMVNPSIYEDEGGDTLAMTIDLYDGYGVQFNLEYGIKTLVDSSLVNQIGVLSALSGLSTFRLHAAVNGGATRDNHWTVSATSDLALHAYTYTITVTYFKRYLGI